MKNNKNFNKSKKKRIFKYLIVLDSNENPQMHTFDIRTALNFPEELKKKDFFSMGYPYLITAYYNLIAFSSDYGVLLLKIDESALTLPSIDKK